MRGARGATFGFVVVLVASACSDADGTGGAEPGYPIPPPSATETETERAPNPSQCAGFTRGDTIVNSRTKPIPTPEAFGGEIAPGTYDLTELNLYAPPPEGAVATDEDAPAPAGTETAQATIIVTKDAVHWAVGTGQSDDGSTFSDETLHTAWYHVDGTQIVYDEICPTLERRRIPYLAVGPSLVLFTRPDRGEFYTLRR